MIETVKRVVCDRCGGRGPPAVKPECPLELAQRAGWITRGSCQQKDDGDLMGDYCPRCYRPSVTWSAGPSKYTARWAEAKAERDRG